METIREVNFEIFSPNKCARTTLEKRNILEMFLCGKRPSRIRRGAGAGPRIGRKRLMILKCQLSNWKLQSRKDMKMAAEFVEIFS
jgi:hypothetical protein